MSTDWPAGVFVRPDEPLARHTALRTGGPCAALVVVHDREALAPTLATMASLGWKWMLFGAGTRLVVRDGGLAAAVLRLGTGFTDLRGEGTVWDVGAACPVPALAAATAAAGHGGVESLAGTPGSFGAALALDQGPDSGWDSVVETVRYLKRGVVKEGTVAEARQGRQPLILGARLRLVLASPDVLRQRVRDALAASRAGSWYEQPKHGGLRRLLRRSGLGDVRLRRVAIPTAAPELLVNLGGARAADLSLLHKSVLDRVRREQGIDLQAAVRWVGQHDRGT